MKTRQLLGALLFLAAPVALGAQVTAKKDGVEVLAEASTGARVVSTLKKGDVLESMERKGMFWQVKTKSGKTGYVSILVVNRDASAGSGGLSKALQAAAQEGREGNDVTNARSRSAVMGVRGLDESSETEFAGNVRPNMRRVYAMEDRKVNTEGLQSLQTSLLSEIEARAAKRGLEP